MRRYRIKRHYIGRTRIILLCVLVCIAAAVTGWLLTNRMKKETVFPIGEQAEVAAYGGRIIALESEQIMGFNAYAKQRFCFDVPRAESLIVSEDMAAAYGEHDVYLLKSSGRIDAHIKSDVPITHVLCGSGLITVITQDAAGDLYAASYDAYGNLIDAIAGDVLLSGDRLMDAQMRGNVLMLSTINTAGAQVLCRVYLFNVQENAFLCRVDVYDQLICEVFADEKNVFIIGTDSIICYNYSGVRLWQMPSADLSYVYSCEYRKNAVLLFAYDNASGARLVYRTQSYALSGTPRDAALLAGRLFVNTDDALVQIALRGDSPRVRTVQHTAYTHVLPAGRGRMLVFDGDQWIARMIP